MICSVKQHTKPTITGKVKVVPSSLKLMVAPTLIPSTTCTNSSSHGGV
ncbi:Uncharacterised protein [Vibrio cholerae]|nr:Uncharacterised protein [Vibrio cholerae]CSC30286.1 Uncharacterised protein [Vibrio cholerae]